MKVKGLTAEINNMPYQILEDGFLVVRRDEHNASLWYYGLYKIKEYAQAAALEIGNGIVLEVEA